jgi:hypothetical protein
MIDSRLDARTLGFPAPRGAEAIELNRLLTRRTELVANVDGLERRQRSSHQDAAEASDALEQLERRAFNGERVIDAHRKRAEDALAKAQRAEREPWLERARAAQQAVRDADQAVRAGSLLKKSPPSSASTSPPSTAPSTAASCRRFASVKPGLSASPDQLSTRTRRSRRAIVPRFDDRSTDARTREVCISPYNISTRVADSPAIAAPGARLLA